jgi:hypothetical protein
MENPPVQLHPAAVAEARAASQWYRQRDASAADAFLTELDLAIKKIAEGPETWPQNVEDSTLCPAALSVQCHLSSTP